MLERAKAVLFDYLPKDAILAAYSKGRGKEVESGKFCNPASSSALVANTFGFFLTAPSLLFLPFVRPIDRVELEREVRFPWRGGLHPWLDVVAESDEELVGIESKRYEPFRDKKSLFSEAFQRDVWRPGLRPFLAMRDELSQGYLHLDPVQLTKHALALSTQAAKLNKRPVLIYLYAEPDRFPDGTPVQNTSVEQHRTEIFRFSKAVADSEVRFVAISYGDLLRTWETYPELSDHVNHLRTHYRLTRESL